MRNEFTAIIEKTEDWYISYSPEISGANGQGKTKQQALDSLVNAISLILKDRREDGLRGVPREAYRETIIVEWNVIPYSSIWENTDVTENARADPILYGWTPKTAR